MHYGVTMCKTSALWIFPRRGVVPSDASYFPFPASPFFRKLYVLEIIFRCYTWCLVHVPSQNTNRALIHRYVFRVNMSFWLFCPDCHSTEWAGWRLQCLCTVWKFQLWWRWAVFRTPNSPRTRLWFRHQLWVWVDCFLKRDWGMRWCREQHVHLSNHWRGHCKPEWCYQTPSKEIVGEDRFWFHGLAKCFLFHPWLETFGFNFLQRSVSNWIFQPAACKHLYLYWSTYQTNDL